MSHQLRFSSGFQPQAPQCEAFPVEGAIDDLPAVGCEDRIGTVSDDSLRLTDRSQPDGPAGLESKESDGAAIWGPCWTRFELRRRGQPDLMRTSNGPDVHIPAAPVLRPPGVSDVLAVG